jgi:hypothetical protein
MNKKGIIFTASTLLRVAKNAHDKLNGEPPDIDQGLIAIVFAASAFEAFINELDELAAGTGDTPGATEPIIALLSDVFKEAEACRASIRLKYLVAGTVITGKPFERGRQPWQDLDLLFKVRNAIVHLAPTVFEVRGGKAFVMSGDDLMEQLRQRRVLPDLPAGHVMIFLHRLAERSAARWAVNTTVQAVRTILSALPAGTFKDSVAPTYAQEFVEID